MRTEGVLQKDGALCLVVQLEVDPVNREVPATLFGATDEGAAKPGARRLGWLRHGGRDLGVGARAVHLVAALQLVEHPPASVDVVVHEINQRGLGVRQRHPVALAHVLDEAVLRHPVALPPERERIGLETLQAVLPHLERPLLLGAQAMAVTKPQGTLQVLRLNVEGPHLPAVRESDPALAADVVADLPDGADRVLEGEVSQDGPGVLEHRKENARRADLEKGRVLAHVRVPDDDVQPAEPLGVGVRLVPRVDDRPAAGRRGGDPLPDVLRALADAVDGSAGRLENLAGPRVDLTAHEERDEDLGVAVEVVVAFGEVVLVAAVGVARRVRVVLEQVDVSADALLPKAGLRAGDQLGEDPLAGLVVDDEVVDAVALGRRILRVAPDVEVQAGAVLEEDVGGPPPAHDAAEEVAGDLVGAQAALAAKGEGDAVLVLEPEDPALHVLTVVPRSRPSGALRPSTWRTSSTRVRSRPARPSAAAAHPTSVRGFLCVRVLAEARSQDRATSPGSSQSQRRRGPMPAGRSRARAPRRRAAAPAGRTCGPLEDGLQLAVGDPSERPAPVLPAEHRDFQVTRAELPVGTRERADGLTDRLVAVALTAPSRADAFGDRLGVTSEDGEAILVGDRPLVRDVVQLVRAPPGPELGDEDLDLERFHLVGEDVSEELGVQVRERTRVAPRPRAAGRTRCICPRPQTRSGRRSR